MAKFFVAGNSRSGTTMMGRILGNHSSIFTFPELHFFEQQWSPADATTNISKQQANLLAALLLNICERGYLGKREIKFFEKQALLIVDAIPTQQLKKHMVYEKVLDHVCNTHQKKFPCEQTPQNIFYIKEIQSLFEDAFFINMVRDPRDVLLSQKRKWKRRFLGGTHATWFETIRAWTNYHPLTISKLWVASVKAGLKFKGNHKVMLVRFEDLLKNPEQQLIQICNQFQINFEKEMLQVPVVGSSSGKDDGTKKGINADRAGSWQQGGLSDTEIYLCQKITAMQMSELDYTQKNISPNYLLLIWYYILFPIKLGFAFLLNLHRMKNIVDTIKRRIA